MQDATEPAVFDKDFQPGVAASLAGVAVGGVIASVGGAKVFVGDEALLGCVAVALGSAIAITALWFAYRLCFCGLQRDCDLYGRHISALTFLLLVVGLCNAAGTSTMALNGGFEVSVRALTEGAEANSQRTLALASRANAQNEVRLAKEETARTEAELVERCGGSTGAGAATPACEAARALAHEARAKQRAKDLEAQTMSERVADSQKNCDEVCEKSRRALFFMLTLSTVMSLFGAVFYVVNSVRMKRPGLPGEPADGAGEPPASDAGSMGGNVTQAARAPSRVEPFDAHAFWGGAFFRVGEAILFTFAFFWLIWTSELYDKLVWLPVIALFVGMFVRAGEAIVFRLGMRLLSAVEALLPFASLPSAPVAMRRMSVPPPAPADRERASARAPNADVLAAPAE
jgi:hypothetical protein